MRSSPLLSFVTALLLLPLPVNLPSLFHLLFVVTWFVLINLYKSIVICSLLFCWYFFFKPFFLFDYCEFLAISSIGDYCEFLVISNPLFQISFTAFGDFLLASQNMLLLDLGKMQWLYLIYRTAKCLSCLNVLAKIPFFWSIKACSTCKTYCLNNGVFYWI